MTEIEFWEQSFLACARLCEESQTATSAADKCKEFATRATKHRDAKVKEIREHLLYQEGCRKRLAILRELGPANDEEADEYSDLVMMEECGEI